MAKLGGKRAVGVSRDAMRRSREKQQQAAPEIKTASAAPSDKNLIAIPRPAARMQGGPRDGWVYFVEDLEHEQRIAERMSGVLGARPFGYKPTRAKCVLPWTGGVEGIIWRWTGEA